MTAQLVTLPYPFALTKSISKSERVIEGYAAITGNEDLQGDIIAPGAFANALGGRDPSSVPVFVSHQITALPVGYPIEIREDGRGLFTRTKIHNTSEGDSLLTVAAERALAGNPLGMSIGYSVPPGGSTYAKGKRYIKAVRVGEYSFTVIPANTSAVVTAVKRAPLSEWHAGMEAEREELYVMLVLAKASLIFRDDR